MEKRNITESFDVAESIGAGRIDKEKGIIFGAVVLPGNKKTANGNVYTDAALRKAVPLYEGAKFYINHDRENPVRKIQDLAGAHRNLRVEEGKLKSDIHILPSMKDRVVEIAEANIPSVGLSIVDRGAGEHKNGAFIVEDWVGKRRSADLVTDASSTTSLFEENGGHAEEEDNVEKKDINIEWLRKETPNLVEALQNEGKAAVLTELEESKKKGKTLEESLAAAQKDGVKAQKIVALHEARFLPKIHDAVLKVIEPESVTLDTAKAVIASNKATVESLGGKRTGAEPTVVGSGARNENRDVQEEAVELPSKEVIEAALSAE